MLQHFSNHHNAFLKLPTSSDHNPSSPTTLTIDTTILTSTVTITNSLRSNCYATPPLSSLNHHHHQRPPPPSGLTRDKGAARTLIDTRGWTFWRLAWGMSALDTVQLCRISLAFHSTVAPIWCPAHVRGCRALPDALAPYILGSLLRDRVLRK